MAAGIIILGLLVTGCSLFNGSEQTGGLQLSIGDNVSRSTTLAPDFDMSPLSYTIIGTGPEDSSFTLEDSAGEPSEWASLTPGNWSVTVNAFNAEGEQVGSGTEIVEIEVGVTKQITVTVTPLNGIGTLSLELSYDAAEIADPIITASLTPSAGGDTRDLTFALDTVLGLAEFSADDIPTGYHTLIVKLYDGETFKGSQIHAVRIIKDQITETLFDLGHTLYAVGGKVVDDAGNGLEDITVLFSHDYESVVTNADGTWSKNGLDPFDGPITVSPASETYVFSPGSVEVTGTKQDIYFVGMTQNEYFQDVVLQPTTKMVPSSEFDNIVSITSDTISFSDITDYLGTLKVGDVLVASEIPGDVTGLLSRITAISEDGKTFTIEDAYLEDVVESGGIDVEQFVTADYIIDQLSSQQNRSRGVSVERDDYGKISYKYTPKPNVEFKGSIKFIGLTKARIFAEFENGLKEFEIKYSPGFDFEQELVIGADVEWKNEDNDKLFTIVLPPIPIFGPVTITPEIRFVASAEVSAQAGIVTAVGYSRGYDLGIRYQDNEWNIIREKTGDGVTIQDPMFQGSIAAKVYGGIEIIGYGGFRYVGEAGVGVRGYGNLETNAEIALFPDVSWQYDFDTYLTAGAFALLRILGFARFEYEFLNHDFFRTNLAYGISGRVTNSLGNGVEGVEIAFSDDFSSVTTNSNGYWQKHMLRGEVTVTPQKENFFFYPASAVVTQSSSDNNFLSTEQLDSPEFSIDQGTYQTAQSVEIIKPMSDAFVRYTTDGNEPTEEYGTIYNNEPIEINSSTTIKAIAYRYGYANSQVASASYTINYPPASLPSFSVSPGTYTSSRSVAISSTTAGAAIRYTTNGSTPSETNGTVYSGPVTISSDTTLKAIAYKSGYSPSGVRSGTYYIRPLGQVSGTVYDATTGSGIGNVQVGVSGLSGYSTTSGSNGYFSFGVPSGSRTLTFYRSGYTIPSVGTNVGAGSTTTIPQSSIVASSTVPSGNLRIVLTWGANPSDLDLHLKTPEGQHVFYSNKNPSGAGANLDVDDVSSYGPETITITSMQTGTYHCYVHKFAGSGGLTTSGAKIQVFNNNGLTRTYTVPTSGSGDYWRVFTLNNGSINTVNQISTSAP